MFKTCLALALLSPCIVGCSSVSYTGDKGVKFHAYGLFCNVAAKKVILDKKTEKTSQGLAVGEMGAEVQEDLLKDFISAIVAGAIKGVKP